ncbi:hypothetical protein N9933_01735 [bacterium]|nr:hypothetical protein [bacterium]
MKNTIIIIVFLTAIISCSSLSAQNLFFEAKAGYAYVDHQRDNYSKASHIPLNLSLGGGLKHFQIGGDLILSSILPETYLFYDEFTEEQRVREEIEETYYGAFLRYNSSYSPETATGFIIKAGAGLLNSKKIVYALPSDVKSTEIEYEPALQYLGEIGVSIPLGAIVHIYIGGGVTYTKKEIIQNEVQIENFSQLKYIGQLGLSVNLDFTN